MQDPRKKYTPEEPRSGLGYGGQLGATGMQHILQSLTDAKKGINERAMDPREQILRHAKAAAADPQWINHACVSAVTP